MTNLTNEQLAKCREAFDKWAVSPQIDACVSNQDWLTWQAAWSAAQPQWLPIDTAPKDGTTILGVCEGETGSFIMAVWWQESVWFTGWVSGGHRSDYEDRFVTHWMPLPTPPTQPSGGEAGE